MVIARQQARLPRQTNAARPQQNLPIHPGYLRKSTGKGHVRGRPRQNTGDAANFGASVQAAAIGSGQADRLHGKQGQQTGKRRQHAMLAGEAVFARSGQACLAAVH